MLRLLDRPVAPDRQHIAVHRVCLFPRKAAVTAQAMTDNEHKAVFELFKRSTDGLAWHRLAVALADLLKAIAQGRIGALLRALLADQIKSTANVAGLIGAARSLTGSQT